MNESENEKQMVVEKSWQEFRETGLFQFMNQILNVFGWAICMDIEGGECESEDDLKIVRVFPARVRFRGFCETSNSRAYRKISQYMKDNCDDLLEEANE